MTRAMSIMSMSRYLVALIVTTGILISAATVYIFFQIRDSHEAWHRYEQASSARVQAVTELVGNMGYGGFIHHFKNFVLRNETDRSIKVNNAASAALNALHQFETQNPTDEELQAVKDIKSVIHSYLEAIGEAQTAFVFGAMPEEVDAQVKVSDDAALAGLETLFLAMEKGALGGDPNKTTHLIALERALGYGGMIHQFKNYVLRGDAPRVAKVEAAIANARAAMQGYQSFPHSDAEARALADIEGVVAAYEAGIRKVTEMKQQSKSVAEIDQAVKVADGPAIDAIELLKDMMVSETIAARNTLEEKISWSQRMALLVAVALAVAGALMAVATSFVLIRRIAQPAQDLAREMDKLAQGNTDISVEHMLADTEIGAIARASQTFRENLVHARELEEQQTAASARERELLEQNIAKEKEERAAADQKARAEQERLKEIQMVQTAISEVIDQAVRGDFSRRAKADVSSENLSAMVDAINALMTGIETSLGETGRVLQQLANGDLSARMDGYFEGVFATLQDNMNMTLHTLEEMVDAVARSGMTVARRSDDIRSTATNLAERTENSAASLEEAAAALEEISSTVSSVSENIERASASANDAELNAKTTTEVAQRAVTSLDNASETTKNINKIVNVIEDIAFQINLLALNAGVEAARAGESGRGFAVVASEVRALAQRSSEAVGEITTVIDESTNAVGNSVSMVAEALDKVTEISNAIGTISRQTSEAAEAVNQQAKGLVSISETITHLDAATQENAGLFVQVRENSEHLQEQALTLENALGKLVVQSSTSISEDAADAKLSAGTNIAAAE
ncbi:methyl-accepting chemotaxis protein [Aliiroseovarius crassostreae]|uniref:methyl-accepting chemotaxis protein n=1 Tax=Aliiroseovarius crassostreae TaxID=154981 RepID=UPI003C7E259A